MKTQHFGGRFCWCGPLVGVRAGSVCVVHWTSSGKRRDVLRVEGSVIV